MKKYLPRKKGFFLASACLLCFIITMSVVSYLYLVLANFPIIKQQENNLVAKNIIAMQKEKIKKIGYDEISQQLIQNKWISISKDNPIKYKTSVSEEKRNNGEDYKIVDLIVQNENINISYEEKFPLFKNEKQQINENKKLGESEFVDFSTNSSKGNFHLFVGESAIADKNGFVTCLSYYPYPGQPSQMNLYQTRIILTDKSHKREMGDYIISHGGYLTLPINKGEGFHMATPLSYMTKPHCFFTPLENK